MKWQQISCCIQYLPPSFSAPLLHVVQNVVQLVDDLVAENADLQQQLTRKEAELTRAEETIRREQQHIQEMAVLYAYIYMYMYTGEGTSDFIHIKFPPTILFILYQPHGSGDPYFS